MCCEIITSIDGRAVLADTATGWALGPVFTSPEDALAFLRWLGSDPRDVMLHAILAGREPDSVLESRYLQWITEQAAAPVSAEDPRCQRGRSASSWTRSGRERRAKD